jgi:nitroimidazol reductase NimA-like FMN-containing flavoprotein (pyridoxamine 5'-phosphate oxidase superfamily)
MTKDYILEPRAQVRRRDRAVEDDTWIRVLLHRAPIGITATAYDGQPFLNSNLFVYDEKAHKIYFHTARVGRTQANVETNEQICFTVYEMGRLLPADTALEFSVEYAGVVVFGTGSLITEKDRAKEALQMLLDKYAPHLQVGKDYQGVTDQELSRTAVYQIAIEQWSGKKKEVAEDFPGAFYYYKE